MKKYTNIILLVILVLFFICEILCCLYLDFILSLFR